MSLLSWTFAWNHSVDRYDVAFPFDGVVDLPITPDIWSYESFGSEWAFLHPVMTAATQMIEGQ